MPDLVVSGLHKRFGENTIIEDLSFTVEDGEFFTLLGPSGCGKSTTLNCLAGLEKPDGGRVTLADKTYYDADRSIYLQAEDRNLGMVFQSYALWPHLTVSQNLAFPLKLRSVGAARRSTLIGEALERVDLEGLADRYPHQLSGGQQQRVALARALVYQPRLLLLDEPLSNLDAKLREQARVWLKKLQRELGITTIYVTHDQEEALSLSDRIAVMSRGEMVQVARPQEIYDAPATVGVAEFIGKSTFLEARAMAGAEAGCAVRVRMNAGDTEMIATSALPISAGEDVTVVVRPEDFVVLDESPADAAAGLNELDVDVQGTLYLGSRFDVFARHGDATVHVDHRSPVPEGPRRLRVDSQKARAYPR